MMKSHTFRCIDAHTCGNPVRVVIENKPVLYGQTMSEKRADFLSRLDWIRTGLMFEPRGHDAMSGSIIYPPIERDSDLSILFIEVSGCLPMCGHGTIGTVTVAIEQSLVEPKIPGQLRLDTPAGLVEATYKMDGPYVDSVTLTNVPSFLYRENVEVTIAGLGNLVLDISYGGNFYAIIEPQASYPGLAQFSADQIRQFSPVIRAELNRLLTVVHPENSAISGVSHVMWTDQPNDPNAHGRNAVFYGERGIDRSPCGTGTSARMAQKVQRGELAIGEPFVHESIIGSLFTGCPLKTVTLNGYSAIIPSISGWARIIGDNRILIDDRDPYAAGFLLQ